MTTILDSALARLKPKPKTNELAIRPILPFKWKQGEHLSLTGDTGSGKTTLANVLLHARDYTIAFRSKADDAPLPGARIKYASDFGIRNDVNRYLLDPPYERQLPEFWNALETVWKQGHWTVYYDEMFHLAQLKDSKSGAKLSDRIDRMLTQGRSKKITNICGMQRPVNVSRYALSQCTHMISFSCEGRDVKILDDIAGREFSDTVASLGRYEFAWFYRPERAVWRGRVQDLLPHNSA
jgi:energy-coupling factor transporter ATP-binding protein EcfA2